ncbi:MAG: HAD family hydrolase [Anaerolineae bacterium]
MPIKALLLDLDDTLLINDMTLFMEPYFRALAKRMSPIIPLEELMPALFRGTRAMQENDGSNGTNAELFAETFFGQIDAPPDVVLPAFEAFYQQEFHALASLTEPDAMAAPLVQLALAQGLQIAIATQPLFPLTAIEARLAWAGVGTDRYAYDLITSYEIMRACKPHPAFFQQVLETLGREPQECLMVGDSVTSDMPASNLGIKTFWVDRGRGESFEGANAQGSLQDLHDLMETGALHEL